MLNGSHLELEGVYVNRSRWIGWALSLWAAKRALPRTRPIRNHFTKKSRAKLKESLLHVSTLQVMVFPHRLSNNSTSALSTT